MEFGAGERALLQAVARAASARVRGGFGLIQGAERAFGRGEAESG